MLITTLCLAQSTIAQEPALPRNASSKPVITATSSTENGGTIGMPSSTAMRKATLTHQVIDAPNGTFGYEILADGKLFVRQIIVPGRQGQNGCATSAQADDLAALVISKIQSGIVPPTVSAEELRSLGL